MIEGQLIAKKSGKQKIVFAFLTGIVTTGTVSFTVVLINLGLTETFWQIWLKSWFLAFLVAFPVILIIVPLIQRFVNFLFEERHPFGKDKESKTAGKAENQISSN